MATSLMNPVIDHLRRAVLLRGEAGLTDGRLLESFLSGKDESAFAVLVRRHGPMVLGVCRRVLRNHHDAEDAFQATFLVLVRKADSVVPREMVANWLYGVAYRTALKARALLARHHVRERQVEEMPEPEAAEPDNYWHDLQPLLDQELSQLPDKYRVPIVLCDLEGKAGKDAARQLGWPEGTVASRLSRGRVLLAKRLTRHGVALLGGSLAAVLSQNAASANVPTSLVSSTVKAASLFATGQSVTAGLISANVVALTEGVLKAMLVNKVKIALLVLGMIGVVGAGLGGVCYRATANDKPAVQSGQQQVSQADVKQSEQQKKAADANAAKGEQEEIQGTWKMTSVIYNGHQVPAESLKGLSLVITKDRIMEKDGDDGDKVLYQCAYKIDSTKTPKLIDQERETKTLRGIYELKGDDLKICLDEESDNDERPAEFRSEPGSRMVVKTFKRDKKAVQDGKKAPDQNNPPDQNQAKQVLDMVLKGFQAYQDSKAGRDQDQHSVKKDMEKLQGSWRVVSSQVGDEKASEDEVKKRKVTVKGDLLIYEYGNAQKEKREGTIKLDPNTKAFDWIITWPEKGGPMLGIYELKGDDLKIGFGNDDFLARPRQFVIGKEDVLWLLVLKRESPQKDVPKKQADTSAEQERTIAAIKELGGRVLLDRGTDSTSTIKVILSETNVKDKDLEQLKGLPTLQELYLFRTKITGEGLKHLKGLTRLQRLDLSHCTELTEAGLANLKGLTQLQTLDLTATEIRDVDLKYIKDLTDLQTLYLRFNPKLTDAGLEDLKGLTKLQTLVLDQTEITDAGLKHLKGLTKLRTLHLANAQLTDATLEQLKGFTDLRSLSLMGTKATDAGLVNLKGLTNLEELYLDGTQVTDAGLDNLKGLTKLRTLSLRLTKTTARGVESLKQSLPKLKVIR